ncbi:hypothetical protein MMC31_002043 [Peltigera leucophlebia]|nr:hypothetical protein [Peltigera leucophlebia]
MFLAALAYFRFRFAASPWLLANFASSITSLSQLTNLLVMIPLTQLQLHASYPSRIIASLFLNIAGFTLLALSTVFFLDISTGLYFSFVMLVVFTSGVACALSQNGTFAYAAGFGRSEYIQAVMAGQGLAGVLPCVAQIASVLGSGPSPESALIFFLTATGVSILALGAFLSLVRNRNQEDNRVTKVSGMGEDQEDDESELQEGLAQETRKTISLWTLFIKLRWVALSVFTCFAVTMSFPVFTQKIFSVYSSSSDSPLLQPGCFIPLAFLIWNIGDLVGRILTLIPQLPILRHPQTLLLHSFIRAGWIPLYLLCNINNKGAVVKSDLFYLIIVQFLFGTSNGYLGSMCMMEAGNWVEIEEREASGGFMGLMLCAGLTVGSLLSFLAA